jgi:hypothetical protein
MHLCRHRKAIFFAENTLRPGDSERYADPENLLVQGINMTGGRPESRLAQNSYHM